MTDNLYNHAEFDEYGTTTFIVAETPRGDVVITLWMDGEFKRTRMGKQEAAKLAGHLLQASDADNLTAVGDDK